MLWLLLLLVIIHLHGLRLLMALHHLMLLLGDLSLVNSLLLLLLLSRHLLYLLLSEGWSIGPAHEMRHGVVFSPLSLFSLSGIPRQTQRQSF